MNRNGDLNQIVIFYHIYHIAHPYAAPTKLSVEQWHISCMKMTILEWRDQKQAISIQTFLGLCIKGVVIKRKF